MNKAVLIVLVCIAQPGFADPPKIYADDGTYLGNTGSQFDPESIYNEFGKYGSKFSTDSINNQFGTYGSPYSPQSPNSILNRGLKSPSIDPRCLGLGC